MASLFEINEQIEMLTDKLVDEETGEINEEVMAELEALEMDKNDKLEGCGLMMKQLSAEVSAINEEIKALKARATAKANRHDRIGEYVKATLKGKPFERARVSLSFRKSEKVEITDETLVPDGYCKFETTRKPVKSEIKKALKNDETVPGCVLVENMNLQVR